MLVRELFLFAKHRLLPSRIQRPYSAKRDFAYRLSAPFLVNADALDLLEDRPRPPYYTERHPDLFSCSGFTDA